MFHRLLISPPRVFLERDDHSFIYRSSHSRQSCCRHMHLSLRASMAVLQQVATAGMQARLVVNRRQPRSILAVNEPSQAHLLIPDIGIGRCGNSPPPDLPLSNIVPLAAISSPVQPFLGVSGHSMSPSAKVHSVRPRICGSSVQQARPPSLFPVFFCGLRRFSLRTVCMGAKRFGAPSMSRIRRVHGMSPPPPLFR